MSFGWDIFSQFVPGVAKVVEASHPISEISLKLLYNFN